MTEPLDQFAAFIETTRIEDIPNKVKIRARHILVDCIAAIIGGIAEPEIQQLLKNNTALGLGGGGTGRLAKILGTNLHCDNMTAALINGTAGTVLEMDEGSQFARGHPGMHVLPALLAAVHNNPNPTSITVTGSQFLRAFIIGYDVAARMGIGTSLRPSMHPHGTWGVIGGAASIAALWGLNANNIKTYLNIASSLSLATSRKTMLEGGTVRNAYTGVSNQMAHIAYTLFQSGFSGEADGINSVFGSVVSTGFDADKACEGLGQRYEMTRNYFKLYACCRYNHAALDALWIMIGRHEVLRDISQISSVEVRSYFLAAELNEQSPKNVLSGKFSVPFAIATTLVNRSSEIASFTKEAINNPQISKLARKVTVIEDSAMSAKLPDLRPANVTITLVNGEQLTASVETNRGDWQDPYTPEQLFDKYLSLTMRIWTFEQAKSVYDQVLLLDEQIVSGASFSNNLPNNDQDKQHKSGLVFSTI